MAYSAETWAELRAAYESGKYGSIRQLHAEFSKKKGKNRKTIPGIKQLTLKSTAERWQKAANEPKIIEAQHQKYLRMAAEIGMTDKWILEKIHEMVNDKADRNNGLQRLYDITGIRAPHKIAKTDGEGNDVAEVIMVVPANGFEPA